MRKILYLMIAVPGLLLAAPASALAKVNIFACTPEWGALAEEIGGDLVEVSVATTAQQNAHYLRAKPSLLAKMRKADLVFCNGASLEIGWLPILLQKAGGPDVQQETVGWLMAADYVEKLEIPQSIDRSLGHVHPEGNPHVHLKPGNVLVVAAALAERLFLIDQANGSAYQANLESFREKWTHRVAAWEAQAAGLKGARVIVYHNHWAYLLDWLGMEAVASLEPKPGIPPTAAHLESLLQTVKEKRPAAILITPFEDRKSAAWLSERTGLPVVELPFTVGGSPAVHDLSSLFEETLRLLSGALS